MTDTVPGKPGDAPATPPTTPAPPATPAAGAPPTPPVTPPAGTPPAAPATPPVAPAPVSLKLPEGSLLDASALERTTAHVAALGLSPEVAQKHLEHVSAEVSAYLKGEETKLTQRTRVDWVAELKADKDFGGQQYDQTCKLADRAFQLFGDPALGKALKDTGFGNFPPLVKWAARIGKAMADDTLVKPGAGGPAGSRTLEEIFYSEPAKT